MPAMTPPFKGVPLDVSDDAVEHYLELGYALVEEKPKPRARKAADK